MLQIRNAVIDDLKQILEIYKYAQDFMIRTGNPNQWGHRYPSVELIEKDIESKVCKVIYDESGIHGVFALFDGEDPTYNVIDGGEWPNDEPYLTIHRIAGDGTVHGLLKCATDYSKTLSDNVRIDTYEDNKIMQKLILANSFKYCGIIYSADGSPRLAYQWTKESYK